MGINKEDIVKIVQSRVSFSIVETKKIIDNMFEIIKVKLENEEEVKISGFGKWTIREKKLRKGRNPHTGETLDIPSHKSVIFVASPKMRKGVDNSNLEDSQLILSRNFNDKIEENNYDE